MSNQFLNVLIACRVKEQAEAVEYKLGLKRKLRIFAEDTQRRLPKVSPKALKTPVYPPLRLAELAASIVQ